MIKLRRNKKILLLVLISFFLLPCVIGVQANASDVIWVKENYSTAQEATDAASSGSIEVDQTVARSSQENLTGTIQGGHQMLQFSSVSNSASFTRHIMCKDHDKYYNPIDPTTIFRPSDTKAVCLITISIKKDDTIDYRWYYRSDSSKTWVHCREADWNYIARYDGPHFIAGYFYIKGYWPEFHYPRAYKVEVYYLNSSLLFSEFFEVTNGGLNSPRMCEDVDVNGYPVNIKSRFTIGVDTKAHHHLRFGKVAYFNNETRFCHNFTTVWIQPNNSTYKTYSGNFPDYKDTNVTLNYWEHRYTPDDYISIDSSTPVGNWKVEVYLDSYYFNNTWIRYGPIATTPFIVGGEPVADWTFMVYLDADSNLEEAGIEIFLKMSSVGSSSRVNIVVQMDKNSTEEPYDTQYGSWTDCKRFHITTGMAPTPGNATQHLGELNMGHPDTLKDFVNWTINNYPANYYFLVLWGHGTGCMGVCFDVTNETDALFLPELSQALNGLPAIIDVVLLDACGMAMTEVAYQIKDYANILVGPEGLGYSPAPYNDYLSFLTDNTPMLPSEFASALVTAYIYWCKLMSDKDIPHATMSAIDLTKITSLMATIEDYALKLMENESFYDYQIYLARDETEGYEGPYTNQTGYLIDLYHFVQLINQYVLDKELKSIADQMMTTLENTIIIEDDKNRPDSHGLSIYFPDEEDKYFYQNFETLYEETTFTEDTSWDEFVRYYLDIQTSGYVLTMQTPYDSIPVKIDDKLYTTDNQGRLRVFILPSSYAVNVPTNVSTETEHGSLGVFEQWSDGDMSNPKTVDINEELTLEAVYQTQYYLTVCIYPSDLTPQPTVYPPELWYDKDTTVTCAAQDVSGYVFDCWTVDEASQGPDVNPITVIMDKQHKVTARYVLAPPWWETLFRPEILQVILGLVGIVLTVAFVVPAWVRTRRRRSVIKAFLNEIDEVYSRFKTSPRKCEEELYRLRNTILEGLTDGKITEESYNIMDRKIDKYMEELRKQK